MNAADDVDIESDRRQPSKIKYIDQVQIGKYELMTWYHSPYPDQYRTCKKLFICQYCLKYCKEYKSLEAHMRECASIKPPGKLIYQDGNNSVFEVDGSHHKLYCQCLCLFAKLFIDHKTLYYDVDPFLFYVMTESTPLPASSSSHSSSSSSSSPSASSSSSSLSSHNIVAYFSKEKQSPDQFNLSCILTFPQYQRHGYGKFLIALSYELSRREKRLGSPEKPLSELGRVSYRSYWVNELLTLFCNETRTQSLAILDLCTRTSIKKEDVISALESIGLIIYQNGERK
jgi:histone acetyltransferase MYST1